MNKFLFRFFFVILQILGWGVVSIEIFNPERSVRFIACASSFLCYLLWLRGKEGR